MRGYGRWQTGVYQTHGGLSELPGRSASWADGSSVRWAEGDGSCCPRVPPSPFPDQPRPSLGPQPPVPTALGHRTPSSLQGCVAGTCPSAWPGLGRGQPFPAAPSPVAEFCLPRAIPHPHLGSPLGCTASLRLPPPTVSYSTLSYSAAHALQDSLRQPSQLARPFVSWPRSQLLPGCVSLLGGWRSSMGSLTSHFVPFPDLWRGSAAPLPTLFLAPVGMSAGRPVRQSPVCGLLSLTSPAGPLGWLRVACASSWQSRPRAGAGGSEGQGSEWGRGRWGEGLVSVE